MGFHPFGIVITVSQCHFGEVDTGRNCGCHTGDGSPAQNLPSLNFRSSSVEQTQLQHCSLNTGVASSAPLLSLEIALAGGREAGGALRLFLCVCVFVFSDSECRCCRPVAAVTNPNPCALYYRHAMREVHHSKKKKHFTT